MSVDGAETSKSIHTHPLRAADIDSAMPIARPDGEQGSHPTPIKPEILQEAILNSADFAIIATDADGVIQLFNMGAERMLGWAALDVVNKKTPADFRDPGESIARAEELSAEFETKIDPGFAALVFKASRGMGDMFEPTYIRKDGSRFAAAMSVTALRDDETKIIGYLLIAADNSALVKIAVEKKIAANVEKERLKNEFVATVSHELRTPLTSIVGALALLSGNVAGSLPEPAMRLLQIAHTNSQRLVRLLNDILDIEKLEAGKVDFDFKRIDSRALVKQAIAENQRFAESHDVSIRLDPGSSPGKIRADPDRLIQVLTNLLSNAVKFSPPGEEVVVAVETRGKTVRISIRDHGPGIPADFKSRIFEKFAQADATDSRKKGGTGLGLSISKAIVERLDGVIGFEDALGGGAIFYVELPIWNDAVRLQSRRSRKSELRVLLCEDDPAAATLLSERLIQEGFLVDVALTANEAVACAVATPYSAILVDLQRPEGDGISLIKQLREQPQIYNTLLVVLSADVEQSGARGQPPTLLNILDWLDTPIDVSRLVHVLDRPIVRDRSARPRILHVNSNQNVLRAVAKALNANAEVMSVDSIDKARHALAESRFDVAVLDVALAEGSGFELLHELRDSEGDEVPLVVFSPQDADPVFAVQVRSALIKSRTSIDSLVAVLRKRLMQGCSLSDDKKR